jgi:HAD superfamily hydrolase (TIGR01509 family)
MFKNIDITNIKGILLDLDNTLYEHNTCHNVAIHACWEKLNSTINKNLSEKILNNYYQIGRSLIQDRLCPGGACRSRLLYFTAMLEAMSIPLAYSLALHLESTYTRVFLKTMVLYPEGLNFLNKCKVKNIPVCIVTNLTSQFQIKKIIQLGIQGLISYMVTSEEAGIEKPNPAIFRLALKKMNLEPSSVIMIGDDQEKDVDGAQKLGIKSFKI